MTTQKLTLYPFSNETAPEGVSITANVSHQSHLLAIQFSLADPQSLVLIQPRATVPARCDNLWQATCFEFFLSPQGLPTYWEFNFSPSGDWNAYHLDAYRQGLRQEPAIPDVPIVIEQSPNRFTLSIQLDLSPLVPAAQAIDLGITAVVKTKRGAISYWALEHRGTQPDFHVRESFVVAYQA